MRWSLPIAVVLLLVVSIYVISVYKSDASPCTIEVIGSSKTPKGDLVAVEFTKKCGATSDLTSNISILPASIEVGAKDIGNVYIAKGDEHKITMTWKGEDKLIIGGSAARPYKQASEFGGITVLYSHQQH